VQGRNDSRDYETRDNHRPLIIKRRDEMTPERRSPSPGFKIQIENLPTSVDSYQLRKAFKDFGRVKYCKVDEEQGKSKGRGIIGFETKESASAAVKTMDKAKFNGNEVRVTLE